jgi:hypothetical protein
MKKILILLLLAGCNNFPKYEATRERYDAPVKSQIITKIVLQDVITKENVTKVLNKNFEWDSETSMKFHDKPTHIFVYVYADTTNYKLHGDKWLGMISMINNQKSGIALCEQLAH